FVGQFTGKIAGKFAGKFAATNASPSSRSRYAIATLLLKNWMELLRRVNAGEASSASPTQLPPNYL
ncbi:MAG: hypothetical protein ACKO7W_01175, partial [Elainella sp.]